MYRNVHEKSVNELHFTMNTLVQMLEDRLLSIDKIYLLLEEQLESDIQSVLNNVNETYEILGHVDFDLKSHLIDEEISDLYILDNENRIIKTTFSKDLNLIFNDPPFSNFLDNIRNKSLYQSERTALSSQTGNLKKYAYLGSKDSQYIFEVSYDMSIFDDILQGDSFANLSSMALADFDYIQNIEVYNHLAVSYGNSFTLNKTNTPKRYEAFKLTQKNYEKTSLTIEQSNHNQYYYYIPYTIGDPEALQASFVIEIMYTDEFVNNRLRSIFIYQMIIVMVLIGLLVFAFYYYNIKFINPLKILLEGIRNVSNDNFDTQINIPVKNELKTVANAFNEMTLNLKSTLETKDDVQKQLKKALRKNKTGYFETIRALSNAIDAKDTYTYGHCDRVMEMSLLLGQHLRLDNKSLEILKYASILHDIGKIGIDDSILNKKDRYTLEEYDIMKDHPLIGYNIINDVGFLERTKEIILCHHERIDGQGYPRGLKENQIPYLSKIISITDAFDAMTSKRIYKQKAMTIKEAFTEMKANKDTQFDGHLVDSFIEAYINKYGTEINTTAEFIEN